MIERWIKFLIDEASKPPDLKERENQVKKEEIYHIQVVGAVG